MPVVPAVAGQRSHLLVVLSNARPDAEADFRDWYVNKARGAMAEHPSVLAARHYELDAVDVTRGRYPQLPYRYLGLYALGIDGAEEGEDAINAVTSLHSESGVAEDPATWLYFPISEPVGTPTADAPVVILAYANGVPGHEEEFREWYSTRHIRHALYIKELVSGQCFLRTGFQQPGSMAPDYEVIAVYEQVGASEDFVKSIEAVPREKLAFPTMDKTRFSEAAYRLLD